MGWPLLAGAEDSRTNLFRLGLAFEGMTSDFFAALTTTLARVEMRPDMPMCDEIRQFAKTGFRDNMLQSKDF